MKSLVVFLCFVLGAGTAYAQATPQGAAGPACHGCAFSDGLDQLIRLARARVASGDSCLPLNLLELVPPKPDAPESDESFLNSKAIPWSAWSTRFHLLSWYLPADSPPRPQAGTANQYERLPNAAGRLLYLARATSCPELLLEFQGSRFRLLMLNYEARGESTQQFYCHADHDLLVLTNTDGVMSKIYNASTTWLSIFDVRHNTWLLDNVVAADHDTDSPWSTERHYQVKDAGRTVVLGPYRDYKGRYQSATLVPGKDMPRSRHNLSPGTYHLLGGRYQRAVAGVPQAARRPAVGVAEVNGTFRNAQGRELALLALGGGRLRVGFRYVPTHPTGGRRTLTGEASIAADSAVLAMPGTPGAQAYSLRLRFERPGTVQVRGNSPGCPADALGTYHKISAAKPVLK